jgi:hypothetical protein
VDHDGRTVRDELHVELERVGAALERGRERRQRVFRELARVTAMRDEMEEMEAQTADYSARRRHRNSMTSKMCSALSATNPALEGAAISDALPRARPARIIALIQHWQPEAKK